VSTLLARIASPDAPDRDRLHLADFTLMSRESAAFVPR
jgi:hypothetical protein